MAVNAERPPGLLTGRGAARYDDGVTPAEPAARRSPRCPTCRTEVTWQGNPNRPFCSLVCRLIDLGVWLDERYRVAGEPIPTESSPEDHVASGNG
jgi:hypothetical protein